MRRSIGPVLTLLAVAPLWVAMPAFPSLDVVPVACAGETQAITNDVLGVTARYVAAVGEIETDGSPAGMKVLEVQPDKPGAFSGLRPGDLMVGLVYKNVLYPDKSENREITEAVFQSFPPPIFTTNTSFAIRLHRPFQGVVELTIYFSRVD